MFEINFIQPEKNGLKKRWCFIVLIVLWVAVMTNYFVAHREKSLHRPIATDRSELRLQGVLIRGQTRWALLSEKNGGIKRVKVGERLAKRAMVVKRIMPGFVELSGKQGSSSKIYFS